MTEPQLNNLAEAVIAVMSEVASLAKDGHNDFSNYSFTTEAMVVNTLRPLMVKHGLALVPHNISVVSEAETGAKMRRVAISASYLLLHKSGESLPITVPGEGMDSLDKSTAKALTGSLKYALIQTFLVGRGEDGDNGAGYNRDDAPAASRDNSAERAIQSGTTYPAKRLDHDFQITWGTKWKGHWLTEVDNDYIRFLVDDFFGKSVNDPSKAQYRDKNKAQLDKCLIEKFRRAQNAQNDDSIAHDSPF